MLIREFTERGRVHFVTCRNSCNEQWGRLVCKVCGSKDVMLIAQTDRQMRQGRER